MKNNIDKVLEKIKKENQTSIMAHMITGYPNLETSKKIARALVEGGADIIEIQIPFSDPMADGNLIVEACQKSLDNGTQVKDSFELARFISKNLKIPVVIMTYANIIIYMGIKNFCNTCKEVGISGIIVPDLPYDTEEGEELKKHSERVEVHLIYVVSPAIQKERLKEVIQKATGFIYCTSRQGTTGIGKDFSKDLKSYLERVKSLSTIPIAVGFGISSKKHIDLIRKYADVAVIGSAIVEVIKNNKNGDVFKNITNLLTQLTKT